MLPQNTPNWPPTPELRLLSADEPLAPDHSSQSMLEKLAADAPAFYAIANRPDLSSPARKNLERFLAAAFASSLRYAALVRHQEQASRALALFETSDYLTEILIRHPEEIATLAEIKDADESSRHDYSVMRSSGSRSLFDDPSLQVSFIGGAKRLGDPVFAHLANSSLAHEEKSSLLRRHFRHCEFAIGARDLIESRDVYESFRDMTAAASDAMTVAFSMAGAPAGLAVMALGWLGSGEFDLLSDADVMFICDEKADRAALTACAEKMFDALSADIGEGMVFRVNARLRPRASGAELLITPTQLATHFEQDAQPWDALTYTKLRYVAGSKSLGERAHLQLKYLFDRFAADAGFTEAVRERRSNMEIAEPRNNFKSSPGGICDIDFVTSYLAVRHGLVLQGKGSSQRTLRDCLWQCASAGQLDKSDAAILDHAAELLRTAEHISRLVVGYSAKWLPSTEHARRMTERQVGKILRREFPDGLESELNRTQSAVRTIYEEVFKNDG